MKTYEVEEKIIHKVVVDDYADETAIIEKAFTYGKLVLCETIIREVKE